MLASKPANSLAYRTNNSTSARIGRVEQILVAVCRYSSCSVVWTAALLQGTGRELSFGNLPVKFQQWHH